ncbi:MAG TPA: aldehyde dehydrogenase family protein [Gemmatales bacterium]|nr:aldehyde dehydrogenase family protein [Gemmatales bacterium]
MSAVADAPKAKSQRPNIHLPARKLLIDGKHHDAMSGKTFVTINPATEEKIAEVPYAGKEDVDLAVKAATHAFYQGAWHTMDARDRGRLMFKLADLMESKIDELAALESLDNGKPFREARHGDLPLAIDCLRYYAGWADKIQGEVVPVRGKHFCYTKREPVGVVGQIIPWNFPILMTAWKWGPALASGCTIVMKPAEQTPLSCLRFAELAMEAGFPPGVINILTGFGDTGAALVAHPGIDKIAFTGATDTAKIIMKEAAPTLKRLTFELGGKSPNIVFADANIEEAVAGAFVGIYLNQGQCCCAGSRLFVEEKAHDQVVDALQKKAKAHKVGDPFDAATEQGPQIDKDQFDKIMHYIDAGKKQGAKCLAGGERQGDKGYFIKPTIFADAKDEMDIMKDEIFGPVLSVTKFKNADEVIKRANATNYGLAAAVWTQDINKAHRIADSVRAGTVWINCYDAFDAAAPFGGFKQSGQGRELGAKGLDAYTETKTVVIKL